MPDNEDIINNLIDVTKDTGVSAEESRIVEEETIRLLEEQLVVDRHKHKVGEVIVRKVVETRLVQVPVRSEKLIVEQVGAEHKQLAEIKLGEGTIAGYEAAETGGNSVSGEFFSLEAASNLLRAIATQRKHGCKKVRIELVLEDENRRQEYQEMFNRCTKRG